LGEFGVRVTVAWIVVGSRRLVLAEAEFRLWLRSEKIVSGRFKGDLLFGWCSSGGGILILGPTGAFSFNLGWGISEESLLLEEG
jgi:hypothetical protein